MGPCCSQPPGDGGILSEEWEGEARGEGKGGGEFTRLFLEEKGARAGIKENLDPDITAEFFSYLGLYTF